MLSEANSEALPDERISKGTSASALLIVWRRTSAAVARRQLNTPRIRWTVHRGYWIVQRRRTWGRHEARNGLVVAMCLLEDIGLEVGIHHMFAKF